MKPDFKLALVTGATSGIGESLAIFLAKKRINLVLTGRDQAKLNSLQESLSKNVSVQTIQADLSTEEGRNKISAKIREVSPDLVVNNAGLAHYGSALDFTTAQQAEMLKVDALAVLEFTLDAARIMKEKEIRGVIMNVSSVLGFHVSPRFSVYAASKAFVNSFSQAFNDELQGTGISVLAACPGGIMTNFWERGSGGKSSSADQPMLMTVDFAVNEIWKQIESRKSVNIFDWRVRLLSAFSHILPQRLKFWITRQVVKSTPTMI